MLRLFPNRGRLTGPNYQLDLRNIASVDVDGGLGGNDRAYLHDSQGDDRFIGRPQFGRMTGAGFDNVARAFDHVFALATVGGDNDRAFLMDSSANDRFISRNGFVRMMGNGMDNVAKTFERV